MSSRRRKMSDAESSEEEDEEILTDDENASEVGGSLPAAEVTSGSPTEAAGAVQASEDENSEIRGADELGPEVSEGGSDVPESDVEDTVSVVSTVTAEEEGTKGIQGVPQEGGDDETGAVGVQEGDADVEDEDVLVPRDDSVDLDAVDGAGEGGGEVDQGGGSEDDEAQRAAFEAAKAEKEAIKQERRAMRENPAYIPKRGEFFAHDDRGADGDVGDGGEGWGEAREAEGEDKLVGRWRADALAPSGEESVGTRDKGTKDERKKKVKAKDPGRDDDEPWGHEGFEEVLRAEEEGRPPSNLSSFWSNPTGKGRSGSWRGGNDGYDGNGNGGIGRRGGGSSGGGGWRGGNREYSQDDRYASAGNARGSQSRESQRDGFEGSGKGRGRRRGRGGGGGRGGKSRSGGSGRGGFSAPYSTTPADGWSDLGKATSSQSNNGVNKGNSEWGTAGEDGGSYGGWGKPEPELEPAAGGGNDASKGWGEPEPPATVAETGGSGSSFQSNGNSSGWNLRQQSGWEGRGASGGFDGDGGGRGMASRGKGRGSAPAGRDGKRGTRDRGSEGGTWGRQNSATSSSISAPAEATVGGSGWGEPDISGTVGEDDGGWGSKPEPGTASASTSTMRSNPERAAPPLPSPHRSSSPPLTANAKQWTGAGVDDALTSTMASATTNTPSVANAGEDMVQNSAVETVGMAAATGAVSGGNGGAGTMPLLVPSFFPSVGATPLGAPGLVEGATNTGIDPLIHLPQEQLAALIHAQQQQLVVQQQVQRAQLMQAQQAQLQALRAQQLQQQEELMRQQLLQDQIMLEQRVGGGQVQGLMRQQQQQISENNGGSSKKRRDEEGTRLDSSNRSRQQQGGRGEPAVRDEPSPSSLSPSDRQYVQLENQRRRHGDDGKGKRNAIDRGPAGAKLYGGSGSSTNVTQVALSGSPVIHGDGSLHLLTGQGLPQTAAAAGAARGAGNGLLSALQIGPGELQQLQDIQMQSLYNPASAGYFTIPGGQTLSVQQVLDMSGGGGSWYPEQQHHSSVPPSPHLAWAGGERMVAGQGTGAVLSDDVVLPSQSDSWMRTAVQQELLREQQQQQQQLHEHVVAQQFQQQQQYGAASSTASGSGEGRGLGGVASTPVDMSQQPLLNAQAMSFQPPLSRDADSGGIKNGGGPSISSGDGDAYYAPRSRQQQAQPQPHSHSHSSRKGGLGVDRAAS